MFTWRVTGSPEKREASPNALLTFSRCFLFIGIVSENVPCSPQWLTHTYCKMCLGQFSLCQHYCSFLTYLTDHKVSANATHCNSLEIQELGCAQQPKLVLSTHKAIWVVINQVEYPSIRPIPKGKRSRQEKMLLTPPILVTPSLAKTSIWERLPASQNQAFSAPKRLLSKNCEITEAALTLPKHLR